VVQKPVLGKGLASLFPSATGMSSPVPPMGTGAVVAGTALVQQPEIVNKDRLPGISLALIEDIETNPHQPRRDFDEVALQELADSIRTNGLIQPLVVRKSPSGKYELIAGERRLRASKTAGLKQVPVVIRRSTDRESLELALVENIQRQDLNCVDEALAYFQLMEGFSLTQEEIAKQVGKDRATVANHLRLLRLPEPIIDDLKKAILSFGHGKALLGVEDNELRLQARKEVVEKRLSVRDTEALIERMKGSRLAPVTQPVMPPQPLSALKARLSALAQDLTRLWSAKVEVKGSERRGKILIHYSTRQELDRILESMQK
jgi:ParB family chromosome partitioning protein